MKKTSLFLLVLVLILTSFTGCQTPEEVEAPVVTEAPAEEAENAPTPDPEPPTPPVEEVQDNIIVSTVPSVTEILFLLGCGEDIVGVDAFSNYPAETADIEKVGDYSGFDIEKVISLEPTVVFAGNKLQREEIDTLIEFGINVIETEPTGFEDIVPSIIEIGDIVGKRNEAAELANNLDAAFVSFANNESIPEQKPTIYYVMGIGEYGNWTSGEGSFINKAMEIAGGECITNGPDMAPWMDYPLEDLVLADPDILIVSQWVMEADLLADPTYAELTAVKEGNYFFVNPDIIERPSPRIVEALELVQSYIIGE